MRYQLMSNFPLTGVQFNALVIASLFELPRFSPENQNRYPFFDKVEGVVLLVGGVLIVALFKEGWGSNEQNGGCEVCNWGVVGIYVTLTSVLRYHFCMWQKTRKIPYFLKNILFFRHLLVICLNFKNLCYGPLIHGRNYYFLPTRSFCLLFFNFASAKIILSPKIWSLIPQNIKESGS